MVEVSIWDKCQMGITAWCNFNNGDYSFLAYFTHTATDREERKAMWLRFKNLVASIDYPWAIIGDLNVIAEEWEKSGGKEVICAKIKELQYFLSEVPMMDVAFKGNTFIWYNRKINGDLIKERIDRVLANVEWVNAFPNAYVIHETFWESDYCPIILDFGLVRNNKKVPFRYEAN